MSRGRQTGVGRTVQVNRCKQDTAGKQVQAGHCAFFRLYSTVSQ